MKIRTSISADESADESEEQHRRASAVSRAESSSGADMTDIRSLVPHSSHGKSRGRSSHSRRSTNSEGEDVFLSMVALESLESQALQNS